MNLAEKEFDKAGSAVKAAQDLVSENPDGFNAEQKTQYDTLVEAAEFHHQRGMDMKRLADVSSLSQKDAEFRENLEGMVASEEAPQSVLQVEDHAHELRQMARGVGVYANPANPDAQIEFRQSDYLAYRDFIAQGGTAAEWVKQAVLSPGDTDSGGNTVPTRVATSFFENLYRVNGIRNAGATVLTTDGGETINLPKAGDPAIAFTQDTTNVSTLQTAISAAAGERDPSTAVVGLTPQKYLSYTRIANELIEDSATDIESMVGRMLGRTTGRLSELAYAQGRGTGSDEPDGWCRAAFVGTTAVSGTGNARRPTTTGSNAIAYAERGEGALRGGRLRQLERNVLVDAQVGSG